MARSRQGVRRLYDVALRRGVHPARRQGDQHHLVHRPGRSPRSRGPVRARRSRRLLSLRDTARAMSQENVELVRSLQPQPDADLVTLFLDDGVLEALAPFFHEKFEVLGPNGVTEHGEGNVGLDGLRALWLDWLDPWESYRTEIEDVIDAGDEVVVLPRDHARRRGMEVEVSLMGATVWTVRDRKISRVAFYLDRAEALDAVGLSEQDAHADS